MVYKICTSVIGKWLSNRKLTSTGVVVVVVVVVVAAAAAAVK